MPEGTQAHQLAEQLSEQLETALTEMGLDASELYHMSRADQTALIGQVTNKTLSDQSVGELARLVEVSNQPTQDSRNTQTNATTSKSLFDMSTEDDIMTSTTTVGKLSVSTRQFGRKVRRHAKDYNLDPASEADRTKLYSIITDIVENATEQRMGDWRGQEGPVIFHIKDDDVVVTKVDGEFITVLKGGINNERVKNARK